MIKMKITINQMPKMKMFAKEINEVIVDGDVKATLVSIIKESDDIFGDSYKITFDVENNLDHNIKIQARSVSIDGTIVDEATYSMSQEVTLDKNDKAVLSEMMDSLKWKKTLK